MSNSRNPNRLSYLMDCLGVTGRDLARHLHVDYSLVSKWRNNSRRLSERSNHLKKTAEYLLLLSEEVDYAVIRQTLSQFDDVDNAPYEMLHHYLCRWLSDTTEVGTVKYNKSQSSYSAQFEFYDGNHGRRCAVLRFLDQALSIPGGQELLLLSQENMSWLVEDTDFLQVWKQKLEQVLSTNNNITIIHTVDREFADLSSILNQWLPLHMSGNIKSYFYPRYTDSTTKTTLFVIRGVAVVIGFSTQDKRECQYTSFFSDHATVKNSEALFETFLSNCRPLLTAYPSDSLGAFVETLSQAENKPGESYLVSQLPLATTMPRDTLLEVLKENQVEKAKIRACLHYYDELTTAFSRTLRHFCVRYMLSLDALQRAAQRADVVVYSDLSLICQHNICVSPHHFASHLNHLVQLLQAHSNLEVGLFSFPNPAPLGNIGLWIKENTLAVATTASTHRCGPYAIMADEATVVRAFGLFFTTMWESLPRAHRERNAVAERLATLESTALV